MAKLQAGDALDLVALSKTSSPIGDVKQSMLTLAQFQAENLGTWMLMDGASCVGTLYATITGKAVVPNMATDGRFLRQAKTGVALGTVEEDDFKSHTHIQNSHTHNGSVNNAGSGVLNGGGSGRGSDASVPLSSTTAINQNTGGTETRPKNVAVNFMIKVGY